MGSYTGIHLNNPNRTAIIKALHEFAKKTEWWKFWLRGNFDVDDPEEGWCHIGTTRGFTGTRCLTEYLSGEFHCKSLCLGYQSTAGQQYIHLCESGQTVRLLWFSRGEDAPYVEEGTPLPFEAAFRETKRLEAEQELDLMDPELRHEMQFMLLPTSHLPGCGAFARAIGCLTYLND